MAKKNTETLNTPLKSAERKSINASLKESERNPLLKKQLYLAGEAALEEAERDPAFKEELYVALDSYLTEEKDRALFDLPPKEKAKPTARKLH